MTKESAELNMSKVTGEMFKVLFNDEAWTWSGLAYLLVHRFGKEDLKELATCIEIEQDHKGAKSK